MKSNRALLSIILLIALALAVTFKPNAQENRAAKPTGPRFTHFKPL